MKLKCELHICLTKSITKVTSIKSEIISQLYWKLLQTACFDIGSPQTSSVSFINWKPWHAYYCQCTPFKCFNLASIDSESNVFPMEQISTLSICLCQALLGKIKSKNKN